MGILLTQRSGLIIGNIAKLFGFLMNWIFEALNSIGIESIGLCIILFTVIVYTLLLPLTIKQQKFTRISAVMNPEIKKLQDKYKGKKVILRCDFNIGSLPLTSLISPFSIRSRENA